MSAHTTRLIALIASAGLAGGCASMSAPDTSGVMDTASKAADSAEKYIDDATLTGMVKARLLADSEVSGLAINVETYNGLVQLSGFANTRAERSRAVDLARSVEGVRSVRNDILLKK